MHNQKIDLYKNHPSRKHSRFSVSEFIAEEVLFDLMANNSHEGFMRSIAERAAANMGVELLKAGVFDVTVSEGRNPITFRGPYVVRLNFERFDEQVKTAKAEIERLRLEEQLKTANAEVERLRGENNRLADRVRAFTVAALDTVSARDSVTKAEKKLRDLIEAQGDEDNTADF